MKLSNKILAILTVAIVYFVAVSFVPKFYFNKGLSLYKQGNYEKAFDAFKKAHALKPNNIDYRYYYVSSLSELKPTYKTQKMMYEMANGQKDDGAKILANDKIREWKANIKANIGNNYIEQVPSDSNIIRWSKNSFPLKIFINKSNVSNIPDYYISSASRAFAQWQKSVDFVSFTSTDKPHEAQIVINFEPLPKNVCEGEICKYVVGYTNPKTSGKTLKQMIITIYDRNPNNIYFSDKEVYNTILHELGHALGIMGHSYSTDDLMYTQTQEQSSIFAKFRSDFHYLTSNDINTLKLLYMLEPTITDVGENSTDGLIYTPIILGSPEDIAAKKVKEALDYIKASPDLAVGYINLAGAYTELKEYNKAIKALQNALENANADSERFVIYYNFAYVYINLKQYDSAMQYAKLAKSIQASPDILEMIAQIEYYLSTKR